MTYDTPEKFMLSQDFATLLNLEVIKPRSELAGGRQRSHIFLVGGFNYWKNSAGVSQCFGSVAGFICLGKVFPL